MFFDVNMEEIPITGRGGYRPGAGRPKGKKGLDGLRKAIKDYTSPQELQNLVDRAKKMAKTDKVVLMWYLEQVFGKAKATNQLPPGNTTNNIALFLDSLEKNGNRIKARTINGGQGSNESGFPALEQELEDQSPILDSRQVVEQDTVQTEPSSD